MILTNCRDKLRPTPLQKWLLQAAFLSGDEGIKAWEEWKSMVDLDDHLDPGSFRLLPQLYRNLQNQGVEDPLLMKLKGVYRRTWYQNQLLFHKVLAPVRDLCQAGVDVLILHGAALALHYQPPDYGLYPIGDFSILVRLEQVVLTIRRLQALGWTPPSSLSETLLEKYVSASTAHLFQDGAGNRIRLHWHMLPECCQPDADEDFWAGAAEARLSDLPVYTLNPADQLLSACVRDTSLSEVPLFARAADAMMVLYALQAEVDWDRLIAQAQKRRLLLPLMDTLSYVQDTLDAPLAPAILKRIQALPTSTWEQIEHKVKTRRASLWGRFLALWFNYSRRQSNANWLRKLLGFPSFLQHTWRLKRLWQVPPYAASKGMQRILERR